MHPLFLFIYEEGNFKALAEYNSNTSHVLIYLIWKIIYICTTTRSNTSHVLIYRRFAGKLHAPSSFKYIPCSYLSQTNLADLHIVLYSNTSHVLIYQAITTEENTSLVEFKYIPCSYLSQVPPLASRLTVNSNTSHVLIYHTAWQDLPQVEGFKYIPCSYLSVALVLFSFTDAAFKYIPCSYLSSSPVSPCSNRFHSNTSHVLIYQESS